MGVGGRGRGRVGVRLGWRVEDIGRDVATKKYRADVIKLLSDNQLRIVQCYNLKA